MIHQKAEDGYIVNDYWNLDFRTYKLNRNISIATPTVTLAMFWVIKFKITDNKKNKKANIKANKLKLVALQPLLAVTAEENNTRKKKKCNVNKLEQETKESNGRKKPSQVKADKNKKWN